jgi:hypothetical protein
MRSGSNASLRLFSGLVVHQALHGGLRIRNVEEHPVVVTEFEGAVAGYAIGHEALATGVRKSGSEEFREKA